MPGWPSGPGRVGLGLFVSFAATGCIFAGGALPEEPVVRVAATGVSVMVFPRIEPSLREQIDKVIAGVTPLPSSTPAPVTPTPRASPPAAVVVSNEPTT